METIAKTSQFPEAAVEKVADEYTNIIRADEADLSNDCSLMAIRACMDVADAYEIEGEKRRDLILQGYRQAFDRVRDESVAEFGATLDILMELGETSG